MSPKIHLWALAVCGGLVYANALSGPFVFDDEPYIVLNEDIRQLWPPRWAAATDARHAAANSRPLTSFTLALNYAVGGLAVEGYRLVNIGLHILCGFALYGAVRRLLLQVAVPGGRASDLAFCGALLWLVHPLNSEVVNYAFQRGESLMALCYLGTLYCFLRGADDRRWLWASVGCCGLGMMAKEVMVGAPLAVLLCDGLFVSGSYGTALRRRSRYYGGLALTWLILVRGMWTVPHGEVIGFGRGVDAWTYLLNQAQMLTAYLRLFLWPHPLVLDYGVPRPLTFGDVWLEGLLIAALALVSGVAAYRGRRWGFVGAFALVVLAPTSSFVPLANEVGAERRMYLPLAALTAGLVVAAGAFIGSRRLGQVLVGLVAVSLAWTTVARNRDYADAVSLWRSSVVAFPDNPRAHYNLANALAASGDAVGAAAHFRRVLAADAGYAQAHYNLAQLLLADGAIEAAIGHYRRAAELDTDFADAQSNLGIALAKVGRLPEALVHFRRAVALEPDRPEARKNLGLALQRSGLIEEADAHFRRALELRPDYAEARIALDALQAGGGEGP